MNNLRQLNEKFGKGQFSKNITSKLSLEDKIKNANGSITTKN